MPSSATLLEELKHLYPIKIDLSLGRIERLLNDLGNPHLRLGRVIHVAGTNGKGSVIAFLEAFFNAAGYRVNVYTSPHLVRFHERIRLAPAEGGRAQPVDEERLVELLERCASANGQAPITFFEITTAAAFLAFAEDPADFVLVEVGLGGRYDATNVIDQPLLSIITPVDLDHADFLGTRLDAIAGEKAGILKPGRPAVSAPQQEVAEAVIADAARALGVPLELFGQSFDAWREGERLMFRWRDEAPKIFPPPGLFGPHQTVNGGTALGALHLLAELGELADRISDQSLDGILAEGLVRAQWPGRLHKLPDDFVPGLQDSGWELWLDGGHNPAAARVIAEALKVLTPAAQRNVLVFGMLNRKDVKGFLSPYLGVVDEIVCVPIESSDNAIDPTASAACARELGFSACTAVNYRTAIAGLLAGQEKLQTARVDAIGSLSRILICGSLHLAGDVLADVEEAAREGNPGHRLFQ